MEGIGTDCKQNTRVECDFACDLKVLPCFARKCGFWVWGCFRGETLVSLAYKDMQNLFETLAWVDFIRCVCCGLLAQLLVLKEKCEVTMLRPIQASSKHAHSWCTMPEIRGLCLQQKAWSNAQEKQLCKSYALWKWKCDLYAQNGIIQCTRLPWSGQCL